ncbi:hypothetical protein [Vibrio phage vB_pir03]|nr:hypothetical protein [Vibrio phage vB_pir03]
MIMKRLDFIARIKAKFGDMFTFEKTVYVNNKTKVILTCKVHGDREYLPGNILRPAHRGCPFCNGIKDREAFVKEAKEKYGDVYDYSKIDYKNISTEVTVICNKHGPFQAIPLRHLEGKRCMECFRESKRLTFDEFEKRAEEIHGKSYLFLESSWISGRHHVKAVCKKHGEFEARASSILAGTGCKKCSDEKQRRAVEDVIEDIKKIHGDRYCFSEFVYKGNKTKVTLICPDHGRFEKTPNDILTNKGGCPTCKESKGERQIRMFLERKEISFEREYRIEGFNFRWDFYLTDFDIYVEYHGIQHYKPVERFGGFAAHRECVVRDFEKKKIVKSLGAKQITISCLSGKAPEEILETRLKRMKLI